MRSSNVININLKKDEILIKINENAEQKEIIAGVVTGMVSKAIRDTEQDGLVIHKDDYIGFVGSQIYHAAPDKNTALTDLAAALQTGTYDIALVICGESVTAEESQAVYDTLHQRYPRTEIFMIDGQQPIYDYILTLE